MNLLHPVRSLEAAPWCCTSCDTHDTDGTCAPGEWVGSDAVYRYEPGPWLCDACSRRVWGAYIERRRDRMALIQVSRWLGHPARMADVERYRAAGEQLTMWGDE